LQPAAEPEAKESPAAAHSRKDDDDQRRERSGTRDEREADPDQDRLTGEGGGDGGEWNEGSSVDQAEHEERQAERPHPHTAARAATDDRDPYGVVEPAGERDSHHRGPAVCRRQRKGPWALACEEEPLPSICLQSVREQEEHHRSREEGGVRV